MSNHNAKKKHLILAILTLVVYIGFVVFCLTTYRDHPAMAPKREIAVAAIVPLAVMIWNIVSDWRD